MGSRRQRKKAAKRAEKMDIANFGKIPGVPAYQGGTTPIDFGTNQGTPQTSSDLGYTPAPWNPEYTSWLLSQGATDPGEQHYIGELRTVPLGDGHMAYQEWTADGWYTLGTYATGGGGDGTSAESLALQRRWQDLQVEMANLDRELARLNSDREYAIAQGNLELARQTEARIADIQNRQLALDRERFQLEMQLGPAELMGTMGANLGNIEAQRQQFVSNLLANPRDYEQYNIAVGGGTPFLEQLFRGQGVGPQSTGQIGTTPTLGESYANLLQQVSQRPELEMFQEAFNRARQVPQQYQKGGALVTDEPIVAIGQISGRPRFTAGEGGAAEMIDITPLQRRATTQPPIPVGVQPPEQMPTGTVPPTPSRTPPWVPPKALPAPEPEPFTPYPGLQAVLNWMMGGGFDRYGKPLEEGGTRIRDILAGLQDVPRTPGEALQRLSRFSPAQFYGLLPSQRELLASTVSVLGQPPEDFFESLIRGFPTAPNPNQMTYGNFSRGGRVLVAPA